MGANKLIPINLRLPENLIRDSDRLAELEGSTRTELVRTALRSYIERRQKLQTVYDIVEKRGEAAGINTPEDVEAALDEIRAQRPVN
jgi:metal-responsive CopG/Arc/MetJ family transcriptional regulator